MSLRTALLNLQRIPDVQSRYNIFSHINEAASADLEVSNSSTGQLRNMLAAIKDNIVTKDMPTTCGSKILEGYMSPFDATVVSLLKNSGVVVAGKANMDEFGMGSGGVHSHFGPTFNPLFNHEDKVIAGGSSSGSAAAVASGVVDFALGTDTGAVSYTHLDVYKRQV